MQILDDHGADLNSFYNGITPLMRACKCGRDELVEYSLSQPIDPLLRDHLNQTAATYGSMGGVAMDVRAVWKY